MAGVARVASTLIAVAGVFLVSLVAEAGIVRRGGSGSLLAPAVSGSTYLVSSTIGFGEPLPAVTQEYDFNNGHAPDVQTSFAGSSQCMWGLEECWGEYVPGETAFFEGAIWGGQQTANLSYQWIITNGGGDVLFTFAESDLETTTGTFYQGGSDPTNPCVGVFLYNDSVSCQHFSISLLLPTSLNIGETYFAQWQATYTAPLNMHFATSGLGPGDNIILTRDSLSSASRLFPIMRIAVPEAPAALIIVFGLTGILGLRRRRKF